jgi:hypothetical protein
MRIDQVKSDIEAWIINFLEVPNPALGSWSPCPYARRARLNNTVDIRLGTEPYTDLQALAEQGLGNYEVIVYVYDPAAWTHEEFAAKLESANLDFLLDRDILCLEDHPADPEIVNGVTMNQGKYAMVMCQSLSDLNEKARAMALRGFYDTWPEQYLKQLFQHRQDPRQ